MAGTQRNDTNIVSKIRNNHAALGVRDNVVIKTEISKPLDTTTATVTNRGKAIYKMIRVDPEKLKQFGLDLKIKTAVAQSIDSPVNKSCNTANRTVKLIQKAKITPALSPKCAEKIPETSFDLNLLQQLSDNMNGNRTSSSSCSNQSNKVVQQRKANAPNNNIKIVKSIPKVKPVKDSDNNFKGWSDEKTDQIELVRNNNVKSGSPIMNSTAKRLSDAIKSKINSIKIQNDVKMLDVVPLKNEPVIEHHVAKSPEQTNHRLVPKPIEVSKVIKTSGSVKKVLTVQTTIVDSTIPPAVTYDVDRIATCSRGSLTEECMASPPEHRSVEQIIPPTGFKTPELRNSTAEFSKIPPKLEESRSGGKKPQKLWSKFNKFKKRNKKLQKENEELKNRLYSLMKNMNSTNSPNTQIHLSCEEKASPDRVEPATISLNIPTSPVLEPSTMEHIQNRSIIENTIDAELTQETLPFIENLPTPVKEVQTTDKDLSLVETPIQEIKITNRLRGKKNTPNLLVSNQRNTIYISRDPARVDSKETVGLDLNKNNLVDLISVIIKKNESPYLSTPVITQDHDNEILVPEMGEELEISDLDVTLPEECDEIPFSPEGLYVNQNTHILEDVQDDMSLDMNISIDSFADHDYSLRETIIESDIEDINSNDPPIQNSVILAVSPCTIETQNSESDTLKNQLFNNNDECSETFVYENNELPESTTSIVIRDAKSRTKKSTKNRKVLEEPKNEILLSINTEDFDEILIEPPAYSPIIPVEITSNVLKEITEINNDSIIDNENIVVVNDETLRSFDGESCISDALKTQKSNSKEKTDNVLQIEDVELIQPPIEISIKSSIENGNNLEKSNKLVKLSSLEDEPVQVKPIRTFLNKKKLKSTNLQTIQVSEINKEMIQEGPISKTHNNSTVKLKRLRKSSRESSPKSTDETPVPLLTKIRRRSRKSISPSTNFETASNSTVNIPTESRGVKRRIHSLSRKRIEVKESTVIPSDDDSDFNGFPDIADAPSAPLQENMSEPEREQKIVRERKIQREPKIQKEPTAINSISSIETEKQQNSKLNINVTCGNCKETVIAKSWASHLKKHNGLAFREGLDQSIDLTDFRENLKIMINYMKSSKVSFVTCEKCGTTRKSALGLISHVQICGVSVEERRVSCPHCGNRLLPSSLQGHVQNSCSALKKNTDIELTKEKESKIVEDVDDVLTQSGRAKRRSVMAAEKKIKNFIELIDDVNIDNHFTEKRPLTISGGTKRGWTCQLQNTGIIKCRIKTCAYTTDSMQEMWRHATSCYKDEVFGFYCRHCKFYSQIRDPMIEHLTKEHGNLLTSMNNLEFHSGSEASAGEESSESDGSSGEDEIECDDGSDVEDNDGNITDEDGNERTRIRSSAGCSSGGGSDFKPTEMADTLLRDYSLLIRHQITSKQYNSLVIKNPDLSFYNLAFKWTLDFIEKYYSCDPLYINLTPSITGYINESDAKDYIPTTKTSPQFSFRMPNMYEAEFGRLAKKVNSNEWDNLELFTGKCDQKYNTILFCGGPILCLDWATFPGSYKDDQYIAVSCYHDYNESTRSNELQTKKGLIQVWNLGTLLKKQTPIMKYAIKVDYGPVCDIKFCPSGGYIPNERIGLLAVTSLIGDVYIYSLPCNIDETQSTNIIELQPNITLRPSLSDTIKCRQGFRLSWTKDKTHSILAAGYTDGWVAVWNLKTDSKLLKKLINGRSVIIPTKLFHPFSGTIRGLEIFHINNSQWLMVAADKNVKMFDLKTFAYPHEVSNVYQKSTITCGAWSIHWPGYLLGLNESFCLLRNSVTLTQPHEIGYKNYPMQSFDATVTDIAINDYFNVYAAATDSGDIISYLPRDLLLNITRKGNRRIKMILGYTDAIDLDTEQISDIPSKFGIVFCDLAQPVLSSLNDLKSKCHRRWTLEQYPIVTITRVKFNPNQNVHEYYALGMQAGFVRIKCLVKRS